MKGYELIQDILRGFCIIEDQYSSERAQSILNAIGGTIKLVHIVLGHDAPIDPNQVFDTLNTAGQRLDNSDLVRNEIFKSMANDPEKAERLYHAQWKPFEDRLGIRLNRYFFPFTLIHDSSSTKSAVLQTLRSRWEMWEPELILADITEYVDAFDIATAEAHQASTMASACPLTASRATTLVRLRPPDSILPFVMRVLQAAASSQLQDSYGADLLLMVESFLVRRGFLGREPTGLHVVFKNLWSRADKSASKAREYIASLGTVDFPSDEAFRQSVREDPLYRRASIREFVLWEYERGILSGDPVPVGIKMTIDHVLPQDIRGTAWTSLFSDREHHQFVHTWANLVPLSRPGNARKRRRDWADVRESLQTETVFKTTKMLARDTPHWTKAELRARAEHLAEWAVRRWPASFPT